MLKRYPFIILICILIPSVAFSFCFGEAGKAYGVSPLLLKSIARVESGMKPTAINRNTNGSIDLGLMQINSSWLTKLRLSADELLANPCTNVMAGARILNDCLNRYGNRWEAVGCYNALSTEQRMRYSWKIYRQLEQLGGEFVSLADEEKPRQDARAGEVHPKGYISVSVVDMR